MIWIGSTIIYLFGDLIIGFKRLFVGNIYLRILFSKLSTLYKFSISYTNNLSEMVDNVFKLNFINLSNLPYSALLKWHIYHYLLKNY